MDIQNVKKINTKVIVFIGLFLLCILILAVVLLTRKEAPQNSNSTNVPSAGIPQQKITITDSTDRKIDSDSILRVGNEQIYQSDYDNEAYQFVGLDPDKIKILVYNKLITDSLLLQGGSDLKYITLNSSIYNNKAKDYPKRVQAVDEVRLKFSQFRPRIEGQIISVWFYNNGTIGPLGYEGSKSEALRRITALHTAVKNGSMTMEGAAESIKNDSTYAQLDEIYSVNAIQRFDVTTDRLISNDEKFDTMVRGLKVNEVSDIYLAKAGYDETSLPKDAYYMFAKVTKKVNGQSASTIDEWIVNLKKQYNVTQYK